MEYFCCFLPCNGFTLFLAVTLKCGEMPNIRNYGKISTQPHTLIMYAAISYYHYTQTAIMKRTSQSEIVCIINVWGCAEILPKLQMFSVMFMSFDSFISECSIWSRELWSTTDLCFNLEIFVFHRGDLCIFDFFWYTHRDAHHCWGEMAVIYLGVVETIFDLQLWFGLDIVYFLLNPLFYIIWCSHDTQNQETCHIRLEIELLLYMYMYLGGGTVLNVTAVWVWHQLRQEARKLS